MTALRWLQPETGAPAEYWRIYRDGVLAVDGVLGGVPDAEGVRSFNLPGWPDPALYTMTAVNAAGASELSNPIALPEPGGTIGLGACLVALALIARVSGRVRR